MLMTGLKQVFWGEFFGRETNVNVPVVAGGRRICVCAQLSLQLQPPLQSYPAQLQSLQCSPLALQQGRPALPLQEGGHSLRRRPAYTCRDSPAVSHVYWRIAA